MALHFDYSKVSGPTTHPADPDQIHPVLHSIIWLTMIADIGNLATDKDVEEFAFRIGLWQRLQGPQLRWSQTEAYITLEDVRQYKGLRTNVFNTKRVSWMARFAKMAEDHPVRNKQVDFGEAAPEPGKEYEPMSAIGIVQWLAKHRWGITVYTSGDDTDVGYTVRKLPSGNAVVKNRASDSSTELDPARSKSLLAEVSGKRPDTKVDEYIAGFMSVAAPAPTV